MKWIVILLVLFVVVLGCSMPVADDLGEHLDDAVLEPEVVQEPEGSVPDLP
jgi:Tfp pilus assembly protein PilP